MVKSFDKLWVSKDFKIAFDEIKLDLELHLGRPISKIECSKILAKTLRRKRKSLFSRKADLDFDFHL